MCQSIKRQITMKNKKVLSLTYKYRFSHLFKRSRTYKDIKDELEMEDDTFSSFLSSLCKKEGNKAYLIASVSSTILIAALSVLVDIFMPLESLSFPYSLITITLITLFLSLKFDFINLHSFREIGEMAFTFLSLYFTHYITLTLIIVLLFENAEALTTEGGNKNAL